MVWLRDPEKIKAAAIGATETGTEHVGDVLEADSLVLGTARTLFVIRCARVSGIPGLTLEKLGED